jgi:hypothetical protein
MITRTFYIMRHEDDRVSCRVMTVDGRKVQTDPVLHYPRHSPTGFNVGYAGSGPADLALAIMAAYYGEDLNPAVIADGGHYVTCPWCVAGRMRMGEGAQRPWCRTCWGELTFLVASRALADYQAFKDRFLLTPVAPGGVLTIEDEAITEWLSENPERQKEIFGVRP